MFPRLWLAALWLATASLRQYSPGDTAPALTVPTLDGALVVGPGSAALPLLVACLDPADPFSRHMWLAPASLAGLLERAPRGASFLFLSYANSGEEAVTNARWMRRQLLARAEELGMPAAHRRALFRRLHFATEPAQQAGGWLARLLQQWQTPRRILRAWQHPAAADGGTGTPAAPAAAPAAATHGTGTELAAQQVLTSGRLDAFYGWLPWLLAGLHARLAFAGWDCHWAVGATAAAAAAALAGLNGSVALVALSAFPPGEPGCSYARMLAAAQAAGAVAVLLAAPSRPDGALQEANCTGEAECGAAIAIPATMLPSRAGRALRRALRRGAALSAEFADVDGPGLFAAIDAQGRLAEAGWPKFASLMHPVWAAQWEVYRKRLHARLAEPALPVFDGSCVMEGEHGLRASLTLPSWHQLGREGTLSTPAGHQLDGAANGASMAAPAGRQLDRLELDLALGCTGLNDSSCPAWDHIVQLFACCRDPDSQLPPCDPCQPTVWLPGSGATSAAGGTARSLLAARMRRQDLLWQQQEQQAEAGPELLLCGRELGRWITPFRRASGRWLTDASHLQALLLPDQRYSFTLQSTAWAGPWQPTLSLRFSSSGGSENGSAVAADGSVGGSNERSGSSVDGNGSSAGTGGSSASGRRRLPQPQPWQRRQLLPLPFSGGTFDAAYNSRFLAFHFDTPAGLGRALVLAAITGHGSDELGCAEFCGTAHRFLVNGRQYRVSFEDAGTLWGCADKVLSGVLPNEHGTWTYGRNGWCDGQGVPPWAADITSALRPAGQANTLHYRGTLLNGSEPRPTQPAGHILMQSSLLLVMH